MGVWEGREGEGLGLGFSSVSSIKCGMCECVAMRVKLT